MKISKKISVNVCLMLTVVLSGAIIYNAAAQNIPMDSGQIDKILSNCSSTKNTLNQLHSSDALLRVNRGQIYESMSTKLMSGFNGRVSNNGLDNSNLVSITKNYNLALDTFRSDYKTYEEHLSSAMGIDCSKQPVSFYDAVALARNERIRVHDDILKLNQYVDQYQAAVNQFEKDHLAKSNGTAN